MQWCFGSHERIGTLSLCLHSASTRLLQWVLEVVFKRVDSRWTVLQLSCLFRYPVVLCSISCLSCNIPVVTRSLKALMSIRAFTFLARSELQLSQYIRNLDISKSSTTLFALHTPQSESALQTIFSNVTSLPSNNLGCLSGQIHPDFSFCASFLNIPRSVNHHVWRSTIPGKEKAQVGRWYSKEQMERETDDSLPSWGEGQPRKVPQLPSSLQTWTNNQKR